MIAVKKVNQSLVCTRDGPSTEAMLRNILSQAVSGALQLSLARLRETNMFCIALHYQNLEKNSLL